MKLYDDQLIVVTGGAGFIGSCVIRELNDRGFTNIVVVDNLGSSEKWKNLVGKQFIEIISIESLFGWLKGQEKSVEAIIHLGACSDTVETNADFLVENNTRYTIRLAEIALAHKIRFIYASSAATYGDGSLGFSDGHELLPKLKPLNMYGYSKHLVDLWALQEKVLDQVVGLKYFNVFGPNESHKGRMASAIVSFVNAIEKEGKVRLFKSSEPTRFKDGEQVRDFLYVKDAARITCDFIEKDVGGIFNVGSGKPETWNTLATAVFKAMGKPVKIEYIPMPSDLVGKYQNYTSADVKKLTAALGSKAKTTPIEKAVGDYVGNYLLPRETW